MNKTPQSKDTAEQCYSPESWVEARQIAALIGQVPSSFTSCVHFLRKDCEANSGMLSQGSKFALGRLLKSPIFSAPMYFGAESFFSSEMEQCDHLDINTFADLFGADGLAVTVSILYLYRRIQKGCDPEEWKTISQQIMIETEIGAQLGKAIPNIGLPLALLVGGMRHLSTAMFLGIDKKNFVSYRRMRSKKPYNFDMDYEFKTWGCNHAQIAAILLQHVGLGVNLVDALLGGLDPAAVSSESMEPGALKVKLSATWIQSLRETGNAPEMTHIGKYYPLKDDLQQLLSKVEPIRRSGSKFNWLNKSKDDVSPEKTPKLYGVTPVRLENPGELEDSADVEQELAEIEAS